MFFYNGFHSSFVVGLLTNGYSNDTLFNNIVLQSVSTLHMCRAHKICYYIDIVLAVEIKHAHALFYHCIYIIYIYIAISIMGKKLFNQNQNQNQSLSSSSSSSLLNCSLSLSECELGGVVLTLDHEEALEAHITCPLV